MDAGMSLLSVPSPAISLVHPRNLLSPTSALHMCTSNICSPFSKSSVVILHDQTIRASVSIPSTAVRQCPTSIPTKERQNKDHGIPFSNCAEKNPKLVKHGSPSFEEGEIHDFCEYLTNLECLLLCNPVLCYFKYYLEKPSVRGISELMMHNGAGGSELMQTKTNKQSTICPEHAVAVANEAVMTSREVSFLVEDLMLWQMDLQKPSFGGGSNAEVNVAGNKIVRSKRHFERWSKIRKVLNKETVVATDRVEGTRKAVNNHSLQLFLRGPGTKKLLTIKEEKDLFAKIKHYQELMRLEAIKSKLVVQYDREPTLLEWAQAVGMSCQELQSCISSGVRSRNRMIYANLRLVIHVAKQYEGKGLNIQDLMQEGTIGLMRSLEKFKPKAGCRFSTYGYWWIQQWIRNAIFLHSRPIRLPKNVLALLKRIRDVGSECFQDGRRLTNEDLAKRADVNIHKLENLLRLSRNPISLQGHSSMNQDLTLQEITADPVIEIPEMLIEKQMMRQHVNNLLVVLSPREREIIQLRFGFSCNEQKSLGEIGEMLGVSRQRVRYLESRAMMKLKASCSGQGLEEYAELL